jgi:membrane protein implicated in regulation of membrane protease activity
VDVWPWLWLVVGAVFTIVELTVLGGSFVLLPFAISAFAASLLGFYDVSVEIQWAVFVLGGGLLFAVLAKWSMRFIGRHNVPQGVGADRLIGAVGLVTEAVDPDDPERRGRVTVHGETWGALVEGSVPLDRGVRVAVRAVRGTRLIVTPLSETEPSNPPTGEAPA